MTKIKSKYFPLLIFLILRQINTWCLQTLLQEPGSIVEVDYASNNQYFVVANSNNNINVYDASTYQMVYTFATANTPTSIKFSKNSAYVGISFDASNIIILNAAPPFSVFMTIATGFPGAIPQVG